ncbi:putative 2,4-dichlorophenol 6-monooxygenase [Bombardia bombarda]|uniref:2,4-dichlorophenol 6-monooxygenase n=1 Tax=Bombardia bombarda TaxID=252184 RepID=A0AA39WGD5_9PEZI|nr:putative 2,4-dichlorophenol 6-monooxygenase [Bombardia bombarda]
MADRRVEVETEFLIVGAGPAGASLSCFLVQHGLKGIMISSAHGTADTPRAHLTNLGSMEALRDIGLEQKATQAANPHTVLRHVRWCNSLAGDEFTRVYVGGTSPLRERDYEGASPCRHIDLGQDSLEPILVQHATTHGFRMRFDTALVDFEEVEVSDSNNRPGKRIMATVQDKLSGHQYRIQTKYLFGADGGRSVVVSKLGLPLVVKGGNNIMISVYTKADLSHLTHLQDTMLHWVMQPGRPGVASFGTMAIARMIKPWNEWLFAFVPDPSFDYKTNKPSEEEYIKRVKELIGDDNTPVEITATSHWYINETYAKTYSNGSGNVFCLGDAVHRHPPMNGLGSNTCIQDAYNLAWKLALVERGVAHPSLLETYSAERQPVGERIVTRANNAYRINTGMWEAFGTAGPAEVGARAMAELQSPSAEGVARRARVREATMQMYGEFNGLGIEMGQRYGGRGVYVEDETEPFTVSERTASNPVLYYDPGTYPGCRLPHVWLNKAATVSRRENISTIDLAGNRDFSLFTGHGGDAWKEAAEKVGKEVGVKINAYSIGFRQDWEDVYQAWPVLRGVEESGAVLVRPDRIVAWRAQKALVGDVKGVSACEEKLNKVMKAILGY